MSVACQKEVADAAVLPVPKAREQDHPAVPATVASAAVLANHPVIRHQLQEIVERHFPDMPQVYVHRERALKAILEYAAWEAKLLADKAGKADFV